MGTRAFDSLLASTTAHIDIMSDAVGILEMSVTRLTARAEGKAGQPGGDSKRADTHTNDSHGAREFPRDDEYAVEQAKGQGNQTRRLGTSHQFLYRSSGLYGGRLCCQARQEGVLAELQGERTRLR